MMGMNRSISGWIYVLIMVFLGSNPTIYGQNESVSTQVKDMMETAITQMNEGEYEQANITFRTILKQGSVLPTDLSYLFAETLFMIHQYHNSKSFLDKYLRLAGTTGRYYAQALDLKRYLDDAFEEILRCSYCDNRGYRLIPCDTCQETGVLTDDCYYCQSVGVNLCEVCKGNGVTTTLNAFNEVQYFTCQNCQGKGQVPCKICAGQKVITETCPDCHGTHKKAGTELCDHRDEENPQN